MSEVAAKTSTLKKYNLKLGLTAGVLRKHDQTAQSLDPVVQAGFFLAELNEIFGDRLVSSRVLSPSADWCPRLEVECTASDIEQIRCYFAPKISRVDEIYQPEANDNQSSFWQRINPFHA